VTFDLDDVFDRSLDEHGYTAVLAFGILHLVEDIRSVLKRVNEFLPTGGLLISETPCLGERSFLFRLFIGLAQKVRIAPPIHSLTVLELEAEIAGAGFDIAESEAWDRKNAVHRIVARKRQLRAKGASNGGASRPDDKALQARDKSLGGPSAAERRSVGRPDGD
jgi:hypothetical protein